ncbi:hypothetical protein BDA99DRAFT_559406 [Phascolomyces articulosus]|uniref:F-box domain-containing protein n=1 Tax=Phascolomyces articulosus TaxID=60185 RepID=A0AAD5PDZ9_9FUNG|nr:hypothetical protein BDA99DRAFT_559406 [Phascolomyces articulosus]
MSTKRKASNSQISPKKRLGIIDQNSAPSFLVPRKSVPPPQGKTTDILIRLPFEIFIIVASFLSRKSIENCVVVNQSWRLRFLANSTLWNKVSLKSEKNIEFRVFQDISNHIQDLRMHVGNTDFFLKALEKSNTASFSRLHSLLIKVPFQNKIQSDVQNLLSLFLAQVSITLTNLALDVTWLPHPSITLGHILKTFRSLYKLEYCANAYDGILVKEDITTSVVLMSLSFKRSHIHKDQLKVLMEVSPNLKGIVLSWCEFDVLELLETCKCNLDVLAIGDPIRFKMAEKYVGYKENGLKLLAVNGTMEKRHLGDVLIKNQNSLRYLYLPLNQHNILDVQDQETLPTMSNLKFLSILSVTNKTPWPLVYHLLQGSPNIKTFVFSDLATETIHEGSSMNDEFDSDDEIGGDEQQQTINNDNNIAIDNVLRLDRFKELQIERSDIGSIGLSRLFHGYASLSNNDISLNIIKLDLVHCTSSSKDPIISILSIKTLETLRIFGSLDLLVPRKKDVRNFMALIGKLPLLSHLHVENSRQLDDYCLEQLFNSISLNQVYFKRVSGYTKKGLKQLRSRNPRLHLAVLHLL